jgi:hypothetical protein
MALFAASPRRTGGLQRRYYAGEGHGATQVPVVASGGTQQKDGNLRQTRPGSQSLLLVQGRGLLQAGYSS